MSAKIESSSNVGDNNENGWDLDDDSWDDWGDAEDNNLPSQQAKKSDEKSSNIPENNNFNKNKEVSTDDEFKNNNVNKTNEPVKSAGGGGGWGSLFGGVVSSVLSTATEITSTVTQGLDKVIGVPDPAEMARINASEEARRKVEEQLEKKDKPTEAQAFEDSERALTPTRDAPVFGLSLVNNVTSLGSKVLNTGLDTLEGIGKKTMNILQENDPMIKNKIKKLGLEKERPNITEILKEAKKETEQLEQAMKELNLEKSKAQLRFELLFEKNCGLVHLEALEILSNESELKIQTLKDSVSGKALEDLCETLNEVKELMELEDLEGEPEGENYSATELNEKLNEAIADAELQINFEELSSLWSTTQAWFDSDESKDIEVYALFAKGVTILSETCALEILKLHKIAELLLIKDHHSTANEVDAIVQLCKQFSMHLQVVANRFAANLSKHQQQEEAKSHISTLFSEMLQARQQIEKAFYFYFPILQIGAV